MRQLGGYLHDLGICLFFQDDALLSKTVILKPEWGTTAVYRVLDDPEVIRAHGVFAPADLRRIWSDATYDPMRDELLQLMIKFQLCFRVPGSDTYIAPQLLTPSRPAYHWDEGDNLVLRYEYDVMPKGIVRRLIVALHYQIAPGDRLWRSGAVFAYEGSEAEVVEVYRRRQLTIRIRGGDPRVLFGLIDKELDIIHRSYPGIRFKRFMPCDCETCSASDDPTMFEVGELKDFAQAGAQIQCRRSRGLRDPVELLRLLSSDAPDRRSGILAMERPDPAPRAGTGQAGSLRLLQLGRGQRSTRRRDPASDGGAGSARHARQERDRVPRLDPAVHAAPRGGQVRDRDPEPGLPRIQVLHVRAHPDRQPPRVPRHVYPVVMPDAGIFDALTRIQYFEYWENKGAELEAKVKKIGQAHLEGIREDLDLLEDIRNTIGRLMSVLADMNTLTPEMHRGTDFEQLYRQLAAALQVLERHRRAPVTPAAC